jgi:adenine-specific DNA-methyltransferase
MSFSFLKHKISNERFSKTTLLRRIFRIGWPERNLIRRLIFFIPQIAKPFISASKNELKAVFFDLRDFEREPDSDIWHNLIPLYKVFSRQYLLKADIENDGDTLNKDFYDELLYILGLEERKEGANRIIDRVAQDRRSGLHPVSQTPS